VQCAVLCLRARRRRATSVVRAAAEFGHLMGMAFPYSSACCFLCCYQLAYVELIAGVVSQLITVPISCTR